MSALRRFCFGEASERGQAIVILALTMSGMLLGLGLAIDSGRLFVERRTIQEAADAGAYAAAVVLYQAGSVSDATAAAIADVSSNGYTDGGDTTVTVTIPPATGPNAGNARYAEVVISSVVRTVLMPSATDLVRVRAVAGAEPLLNGYSILALDKASTSGALSVGNAGSIDVSGAGIYVNSTHATAATSTGSVTVDSPYGTHVSGNASGTWPGLVTGVDQLADPFAGYPNPSTTGMTTYSSIPGGNPITLYPGIYTVPIQAGGGTTITLSTGIYILKAGINGTGNANIQSGAGGVFLYNTTTNYPSAGGTCASVRLNGNGTSSLAPMAGGLYGGLVLYQDPACTASFVIAGAGTYTASGTIYLPNAAFTMSGASASLNGSQIVAKTISVSNGSLTVDFNAGAIAQATLPRLSE